MSIRNLSNSELLTETKLLVKNEREILLEVLRHLKEVDYRRLYLEIGFSSLWEYMTHELQYSEASAHRRIEAMRAIRDLPELENKISSGALSISNVAKAQTALKQQKKKTGLVAEPKEKLRLFESLEHKSQKEAEVVLAREFPGVAKVKESVRPINELENEVCLTVSNEFLKKLELAKSLLSHANPNATTADVLESALDFLIAKKNLAQTKPKTTKSELPPPQRRSHCVKNLHRRAHIPIEIRREVWRKAHGQCEFTTHQKRCQCRHRLEIDHKNPVAFGGGNDLENLRLYCREHNRLEARRATLL